MCLNSSDGAEVCIWAYNVRQKLLGRFDHEQNFSKILFILSKYAVITQSLSLFAGPPTPRFNVECLPNNTAEEKSIEIQH